MIKIKAATINTNRHSEEGIKLLTDSVNKFGAIESISVAKDGTIISGHARKKVFDKKGMKPKPIKLNKDEYIVLETDIEPETKEYYEAQILANTTSIKNVVIDVPNANVITNKYNIDKEEVGLKVRTKMTNQYKLEVDDDEEINSSSFPITIIANEEEYILLNRAKDILGISSTMKAFAEILKTFIEDKT